MIKKLTGNRKKLATIHTISEDSIARTSWYLICMDWDETQSIEQPWHRETTRYSLDIVSLKLYASEKAHKCTYFYLLFATTSFEQTIAI
jgi:hypothetical protein